MHPGWTPPTQPGRVALAFAAERAVGGRRPVRAAHRRRASGRAGAVRRPVGSALCDRHRSRRHVGRPLLPVVLTQRRERHSGEVTDLAVQVRLVGVTGGRRPRPPTTLRRPTAGRRGGIAGCAAASQARSRRRRRTGAAECGSTTRSRAPHRSRRRPPKAVGDVAQLGKRPGRRLIRRLVGSQCGGQLDQRTVLRACEAQVGQRHTAVAQLRGGNAQQPGQRAGPKPQAHERFSTPRVDERGGVRPGDDNAVRTS